MTQGWLDDCFDLPNTLFLQHGYYYLASGFEEWRWGCAHLNTGVECYLSFVHVHLNSARQVPLSLN